MFDAVTTAEVQPLDAAVEALVAAVASLDAVGADGQRAARVLVEVRRVAARLAAVQAHLVSGVDAGHRRRSAGHRSTATWLATSDNTRLETAKAEVALARSLRSMPATRAALAAGDITVAHAHELASLNRPPTAVAFAEAEELLVGQARSLRWADFAQACTQWQRRVPDAGPAVDRADRAHRQVVLHPVLRGARLLAGEPTPAGRAVVAARGGLVPAARATPAGRRGSRRRSA